MAAGGRTPGCLNLLGLRCRACLLPHPRPRARPPSTPQFIGGGDDTDALARSGKLEVMLRDAGAL